MSADPTAPPEPPDEAAETGTLAARFAVKQRAGGIVVPVLTGVIAFLIGGLVVLATGHNPLLAYRDIFNGAGLNWIFHPTTNIASTVGVQPHPDPDADDHPHPHRAGRGIRLPLRHVQHRRPGPVPRRPVRRELARLLSSPACSPLPHILLVVAGATLAGAAWAGIAGFLKATVGAHEVISTIMLNWIAIWVGDLALRRRRPAPERGQQPRVPISNDVAASAPTAGVLGRAGPPGPRRRLLRCARGAGRLLR